MPQVDTHVRVAFADVDSSDRIHFTAMFRYMEIAEHALMRSIGFPYATVLRDVAFPRVHVACDFRGSIQYDDLLTIRASVAHVGTRSWTVRFEAHPATMIGDGETAAPALAEGVMTIVTMDPATARARPLPDELRRALTDA